MAKRARESRNLIDENQILSSAIINQANGAIINSTATDVTDFIEVKKGFYYTIKAATKGEVVSSNVRPIGLYDSNNAYVGNQAFLRITPQQMIDGTTFIIPDTLEKEGYKIRIAIDKAMTEIMLNEGSSPLPYEPYGTIWEPCAVKQYHISKNQWDDATAVPGAINVDGSTTVNPDYIRNTKPIQLESGKKLGIYTDYATIHWIVAFDELGNVIERKQLNQSPLNRNAYTAPSGCSYVHPFFGQSHYPATNITEIGCTYDVIEPYEPYGSWWEPCTESVRRNGVWVPQA